MTSSARTGPLEVRALGAFSVTVAGRALRRADWQRVSAERLFKLLLVTPGHRATREAAAEALWPDAPADASRASLRKAIHFAGRALADSAAIVADPHAVGLDPAWLRLDLDRLAAALERVVRTDGTEALPAHEDDLDTILELGALELLPEDPYEDWLVGPRERLRSEWQRLAIVAAERARTSGCAARAHALVQQLLDRDPTDEAAHRLAIELYTAEGRHHAARRQFELCRAVLRESLDVEPSAETMAAIRADSHDPRNAEATRRATFVGRRRELERIGSLLDRVSEGRRPIGLVIHGPAGIGKSRLLDEVAAYARSSGWRVIAATAVESLRVEAFAPIRVALATTVGAAESAGWPEPAASAIATLVPGFGTAHLEFHDRTALVVGLVAAVSELARQTPVLFAVDDVPWLDPSSLALLEALAGTADSRLLIAAALRDDEALPDGVEAVVDRLLSANGLALRLGPLPRRDIDQLVLRHLGGHGIDEGLGRLMYEQGGGNPLFCLELARAAAESGELREQNGHWRLVAPDALHGLPDSARRIAGRRLAALPAAARDLLTIAAELGAVAPFEVLAGASSLDGLALLEALDEALASGLLVEAGAAYRFAHPLYRLAVLSAAGPARRAGTRLAIARGLAGGAVLLTDAAALDAAARSSQDPLAVAQQAIEAAELGQRDAPLLAVAFGFVAGERLMRLHDYDSAESVLRRSVALWRRLPPGTARQLPGATAYTHLGRLRADDDDLSEASAIFRDGIAAARDPGERTRVFDAYWQWVPYRRGDFEAARALVEEAITRTPADAVVARAHLDGMLGWTLVRLRRPLEALPILEHAATLIDPQSDPGGAQRVLDALGMTLHYLGRTAEGRTHVERALAIALDAGDSVGESIGNLHVALLLARSGEPLRARPLYARAAEVARLTGDAYSESLASWGLAEAADAMGDWDAARASRHREVELLDRMGGNPHNAAMARAHLANLAARCGDDDAATREAGEARRLARLSSDGDYPARIERAIAVEHWAELET